MRLFVNISVSVMGLAFLKMLMLITLFVFLIQAMLKVWLEHEREQRTIKGKIIKDSQKRKTRKDANYKL